MRVRYRLTYQTSTCAQHTDIMTSYVSYAAALDPNGLTASRCNCTYCTKLSITGIRISPSDFHLLTPSSLNDPGIGNYQGKSEAINRYFCRTCGAQICVQGSYEWEGQSFEIFTVSVNTIDQPQAGLDLKDVKVQYFDGLHDNFEAGSKQEPWANGLQ